MNYNLEVSLHLYVVECYINQSNFCEMGHNEAISSCYRTQRMTGEYVQSMMTVGDARYQVTMPRDEQTVRIMRGDRFILDDPDVLDPLAFRVTKPNRVSYTYMQEKGVFITMMEECNIEAGDDNLDLRIANYYSRIGKVNIAINNMSDTTSMIVGTDLQIDADVSVGGTKQENPNLIYSSSDEAVADVSDDGLITAVAEGECVITVSYGAQSVEVNLSVVAEEEHTSETSLIIRPLNDQTDIYCGTATHVALSTVCDGVEFENTEYECSIDCSTSIATLSVEDNIVTISTSNNRKYLGTIITLSATDTVNDVSASLEFKLRGWS